MPKNNSEANTHLGAIAEVKDSKKSANNFQRAKKPNTCLTKLRTETEEIVVFLFGDYAFLSLWHFRSDRNILCLFCLDSKQKVRNLPKREHYNLYTQMHNSFWRAMAKQMQLNVLTINSDIHS